MLTRLTDKLHDALPSPTEVQLILMSFAIRWFLVGAVIGACGGFFMAWRIR